MNEEELRKEYEEEAEHQGLETSDADFELYKQVVQDLDSEERALLIDMINTQLRTNEAYTRQPFANDVDGRLRKENEMLESIKRKLTS